MSRKNFQFYIVIFMFMLKKRKKNLCVQLILGNNGLRFPIKINTTYTYIVFAYQFFILFKSIYK